MNRVVASLGLLVAGGLLAAGCGSNPNGASAADPPISGGGNAADLPESIACGTQYRPDAEQMDGAESPTLTVARGDDLTGNTESLRFSTMTLEVTYWGDAPEGRAVLVQVTDSSGGQLLDSRYQIGTPLQDIEFAGGHGFTGLNYVYHEGAMLQLWCEAPG